MTTASLTTDRIDMLNPEILVVRVLGKVQAATTASQFAEANFLHIINRRMVWSDVENFVRTALRLLANEVNVRSNNNASMRETTEDVVDIVRRAANRRRSYNLVQQELIASVEAFILASERCR